MPRSAQRTGSRDKARLNCTCAKGGFEEVGASAMLSYVNPPESVEMEFDEQIESIERLRELLPTEGFTNTFLKVSDRLNENACRLIELAPFVVVATKASEGLIDVSPKGDPAGFVEV